MRTLVSIGLLAVTGLGLNCGYRLAAGPLRPLSESGQGQGAAVADDGAVTYHIERLKISLRPVFDDELNRQFPQLSQEGRRSTNPYTFGDWKPEGMNRTPSRFTVFLLAVENYAFPKVIVNPLKASVQAENGRTYTAYSFQELKEYYYPYNRAYAGNQNADFKARTDVLRRTMYPADQMVFAGQSQEGYVVFPRLHDDVRGIAVHLKGIALRFDFRNESTETADLAFYFQREAWREQ